MSLFLQVISVAEAIRAASGLGRPVGTEQVPLETAYRRVLAEDIRSDTDIPGFDRSVVDGYAVLPADTVGAGEAIPAMLRLVGRVAMGTPGIAAISPGECIYVPTGGVLPDGAGAVVMIEHAEEMGEEVLIKKPVAYGENVLFRDEDFARGSTVLGKGRRISPQDLGALAASGCTRVPVFRVPVIGILSTGNELVLAEDLPAAGQVRDVNTYLCSAFVRERGCKPRVYGIVHDDRAALRAALQQAASECDAVLISGGSSKDDRDMAAGIIGELGEVLVHGVAIAPGKPTIIGRAQGKPVIGLPGHPASAFVVMFVIVSHLFAALCGEPKAGFRTRPAFLTANIPSLKGREDYVRVRIDGDQAEPLFGKSGLLNTLVRSDGVIRIPAGVEGYETGTRVEVILW